MRRTRTLELRARGVTEEREDRWAVWSQEFGFMVYGRTQEEADKYFLDAITALLNSFEGDSELREYLDRKGVQHRFVRVTSASHAREREHYFERQLEVPLGAAP
jgi:hypothetical protein